jgi:hypothetical protein
MMTINLMQAFGLETKAINQVQLNMTKLTTVSSRQKGVGAQTNRLVLMQPPISAGCKVCRGGMFPPRGAHQ